MQIRQETAMAKRYNPADNLPPPKPKSPPATTKSTRNNGEPWTKDNVKELKMLVKQNTPTRVIGLKLGRTEASVRGKARTEGISLMPPNRSPYNRSSGRSAH
jgi:hypothetical protein